MTREVNYICDKCGKRWDTIHQAIRCEESHNDNMNIVSGKFFT